MKHLRTEDGAHYADESQAQAEQTEQTEQTEANSEPKDDKGEKQEQRRIKRTAYTARRYAEEEDADLLAVMNASPEKDKKKKKWKVIVPIVVAAVVLIAVLAVLITQFLSTVNLDTVRNTVVEASTADSITIKWDPVDSAAGYHIYQRNENEDNYQQIASTEDASATSLTVANLTQATKYSFYVKAFNGNNESEDFIPLENVYTQPEKQEIISLSSDQAGAIRVEWKLNSKADGYIIEFHTDGKDYRDENRIIVDRSDVTINRITELSPNITIGVRVSSYCGKDPRVVGEPSEEKSVKVWDGVSDQNKTDDKNKTEATTAPAETQPATEAAPVDSDNGGEEATAAPDNGDQTYDGSQYDGGNSDYDPSADNWDQSGNYDGGGQGYDPGAGDGSDYNYVDDSYSDEYNTPDNYSGSDY